MTAAVLGRRRTWLLALVGVGLLATVLHSAPARAGANRCDTSSQPTAANPGGVWYESPDGDMFGGGGVDGDDQSAQVDFWSNHSAQAYASPDRACVAVGTNAVQVTEDGVERVNVGEFADAPGTPNTLLPWLTREGSMFRGSDGRLTILRGVDYPYNQEIFEAPYNLTDEDFARIRSWGMNLLRIRISSARSGFLPGTEPEPGYWERLDWIISRANAHGIYVMPSTVTGDWEAMSGTSGHDQLKFIEGTPNHEWWMAYQQGIFDRYRDWSGVVGFDPLNEDNSYPTFVHDKLFMGALHDKANAALRVNDQQHIYFQEPSGWSYWGAEWWRPVPGAPEGVEVAGEPLAMMEGNDIGDENRFYCPKWKPGGGDEELDVKGYLATQSNVPMFICEMWIDNGDPATVESWQRIAHRNMDERLMGGVRVLYGPSAGYGTHTREGVEAHWIREFARPYPSWVAGTIQSIDYDYDARRLVTVLELDGSTTQSEIYTSLTRTYPAGFRVTSSAGGTLVHDGTGVVSSGGGLTWDAVTHRVLLPAGSGTVTVTVEPN